MIFFFTKIVKKIEGFGNIKLRSIEMKCYGIDHKCLKICKDRLAKCEICVNSN